MVKERSHINLFKAKILSTLKSRVHTDTISRCQDKFDSETVEAQRTITKCIKVVRLSISQDKLLSNAGLESLQGI